MVQIFLFMVEHEESGCAAANQTGLPPFAACIYHGQIHGLVYYPISPPSPFLLANLTLEGKEEGHEIDDGHLIVMSGLVTRHQIVVTKSILDSPLSPHLHRRRAWMTPWQKIGHVETQQACLLRLSRSTGWYAHDLEDHRDAKRIRQGIQE